MSSEDTHPSLADRIQFYFSSLRDEEPTTSTWFDLPKTTKKAKFDVSNPPGRIDERVFIGGNYALMPILRFIEGIVARQHFQPILAADFNIPRQLTNEYSIRLLLQCRRAIFEITVDDGHVIELQAALQNQHLGIGMLWLYMAEDESKQPPATMRNMVRTFAYPKQGYTSLRELDSTVTSFL
jgi:hypothetical protein